MAEGILRLILGGRPQISASSAGTNALIGNAATEFAVIAAAEKGVDISGHRARMMGEEMVKESAIILCMEPSHVESVLELDVSAYKKTFNLAGFSGDRRLRSISDPYGCSLREYRECFKDLDACISAFVQSEIFTAKLNSIVG